MQNYTNSFDHFLFVNGTPPASSVVEKMWKLAIKSFFFFFFRFLYYLCRPHSQRFFFFFFLDLMIPILKCIFVLKYL